MLTSVKPGVAAQAAQRISQVLQYAVHDVFPSIRAHLFAKSGTASERDPHCAGSFMGAQPARLHIGFRFGKETTDLVGNVSVRTFPPDQIPKATHQLPRDRHGFKPAP